MTPISLVPRDRVFFDLFVEAGENSLRSARLLQEMLDKWPDDPGGLARDILKAEQEGDRITHDIIRRLNTTFVTPLDREDIHALAISLDDVMDAIDGAASVIRLYKIQQVRSGARRLADIICDAVDLIAEAFVALLERASASSSTKPTASTRTPSSASSNRNAIRLRSSSGRRSTTSSRRRPTGARTSPTCSKAWS